MTRIVKPLPITQGTDGEISLESGIVLGTAVTPPALTANTNNLVVTDIEKAIVLRLGSIGNHDLTGLVPFNSSKAWMLFVANIGPGNIKLKNNDAASSANNRFLIGGNKKIQQDEGILLFYDPISKRWRGSGILI